MATQAMPYAHLGDALATDYFHVRDQFSDEQWEHFIAPGGSSTTRCCRRSTATGKPPSCRGR